MKILMIGGTGPSATTTYPTLLNAVIELAPVSGVLRMNHFLRVPRCPECYPGEVLLQSVMHDDAGMWV